MHYEILEARKNSQPPISVSNTPGKITESISLGCGIYQGFCKIQDKKKLEKFQ